MCCMPSLQACAKNQTFGGLSQTLQGRDSLAPLFIDHETTAALPAGSAAAAHDLILTGQVATRMRIGDQRSSEMLRAAAKSTLARYILRDSQCCTKLLILIQQSCT